MARSVRLTFEVGRGVLCCHKTVSLDEDRCESLVFLAPRSALSVTGSALRDLPSSAPFPMHPTSGPWRVARLFISRIRPHLPKEVRITPHGLVVFADRPTNAHSNSPPPSCSGVHSRRLRRVSFGHRAPPRDTPVPSSWFLTTSMVFSARQLQVCCALLPVVGFTSFPAVSSWLGSPNGRATQDNHGFSRRVSTPRSLPSPAAVPCHQGRSPHAVVSRVQQLPEIHRFQQILG